jgi:serine/threonine protein kinase
MPKFNTVERLNFPEAIKKSLKGLETNINFDKYSTKGMNGYVVFGQNNILHRRVAIKYYYWAGDREYHAEPRQLAQVRSPNIIDVLDASEIDDNWALFITPFCEGGDLDDLLERQSVSLIDAVDMVMQILNGVSSLHAERFVHRDLKPANILICDDNQVVIGDFGSVKKLPEHDDIVPGSGHSLLYRPPESCHAGMYNTTGDLYQCGIILYQLLGGFLPYDEVSWLNRSELNHYNSLNDGVDRSVFVDQVLIRKIQKGKILQIEKLPPWTPKSLHRLIRKATNSNPQKRFTSAADFLAQLHKFRSNMVDWRIVDGSPTLFLKDRHIRLCKDHQTGLYRIEQDKGKGWRTDNSAEPATLGFINL